ncbi:hypothetical protein SAMN05421676_108114 [Salinibacillus kushneri]|uniref:Peptidase family M50 n=1 Tax=Salinibacillus kushneri TaxID=237682 RepID=A0A1I0HB61_9BACI|nr:hypothetical protein [Salinibacillus kushneri]SET80159.1 hypothetical protein SAMN05421676_108114 [Salinibacillus kushneri]
MLLFLLFYIFVIPICTLLHEIGHGIGVISTSESHAHVYLGNRNEENKENIRLGRLHFHIYWSYIGFVDWEGKLNKRQRASALAGGPIMSLLLIFLFGLIAMLVPQGDLRSFLWGATIFNCLNFVATIIPITYPRWMGAYNGHPSDGLLLLRLLRS